MGEHDTSLRIGASLLAMLILPFSLGLMESGGGWLVALCVCAGAALTIVEGWQELRASDLPVEGLLDDIALRTASVALPACLSFGIATHLR